MRELNRGYEHLPPRDREMVDFLMSGDYVAREFTKTAGERMGIPESTVKYRMARIGRIYGIDRKRYLPSVRLVYLRSKELGLI